MRAQPATPLRLLMSFFKHIYSLGYLGISFLSAVGITYSRHVQLSLGSSQQTGSPIGDVYRCTDPSSWVLGPTGSTARTFYHRVRKVFQVGHPKDLGSNLQLQLVCVPSGMNSCPTIWQLLPSGRRSEVPSIVSQIDVFIDRQVYHSLGATPLPSIGHHS